MSESFLIKGEQILQGIIPVHGAKNHALKMYPAALLSDEVCTLEQVPDILDLRLMADIINAIGGKVERNGHTVTIDPSGITSANLPAKEVVKMRASFLFIMPLLHRFKEVVFPHPGGDAIGRRPIDMTLDFLRIMGAKIELSHDAYRIKADKLKGVDYTFKWVSHTGTEALILAAVLAQGKTVIKNAAMEPEVGALCAYLNSAGAKITGIDSPTLVIEGVERLSGGTGEIIPDRIEAGTFAILGALCGNPLKVTQIRPDHLDALWKYFDLMGVQYSLGEDYVEVKKSMNLRPQQVKTHEYPGFITDLQPPMTLLLTQAEGLSMMHETVYDGRLFFTDKLNQMGADIIMADPHRVLISGPSQLYGKTIESPDLRAGITLVMAALIAKGDSCVEHIYHIDRGYEALEERLKAVGAVIERKKEAHTCVNCGQQTT